MIVKFVPIKINIQNLFYIIMKMKKIRLAAFIAVAFSTTALVSCGGEQAPETAAPVEEVAVEAAPVEETPVVEEVVVEEVVAEEVMAEPVVEKVKEEAKPVAKKVEKAAKPIVEKAKEVLGAPAMTFEKAEYNFGEINQGDKVSYTFKFKNTGKAPLIISNARASCGCTVPEWPKEPVAPGASGKIDVVFNSAGKSGQQTKSITITTNIADEPQQQVYLKGMVNVPAPSPAPAE